ncbi:ABC transporter ATP-binding protein [Tissierella sp. MB52-C2]|uniref:ABC transporter ATP-binding protein n=1 Tax=Tissierella sp. MB52-C2 TaxID=3070999 RepID=UPI00280C38CB|nr:ABC transporter ATP-binding protein [Tissierella sp. MB52-C2]WMM26321.1 ABC transporter ATP-binding protein [Tissierella sp. MB52-C2]
MNIVSVKNLTKRYEDITAVDNVSFEVKKGDILGLVGPNGAGKSTTIQMISGLLIPDKGEILFEENKSFKNWRFHLGLVPQDLAIYPDLSARENVTFFASLYGLNGENLKKQVNESLTSVGLHEQKDKKAKHFSGGMKRRLNIACAITHKPKLIIMDEPTVGIDPQSRNFILESIKKLQNQGTTVIYTSHYMEEVEEICNKLLIIDHGQIILSGATDEIKALYKNSRILTVSFQSETLDFAKVRESLLNITGVTEVNMKNQRLNIYCRQDMNDYDTVFNILKQFHISIISIEHTVPTLEEIFLSLTGKELRD